MAVGVALAADLERSREVDDEEPVAADPLGSLLPHLLVGSHEGADAEDAGVVEELRHLDAAPEVFASFRRGKAKILADAQPHVLPVEHDDGATEVEKLPLERLGDRRFAGAGEAGQEDRRGLLAEPGFALLGRDGARLAVEVLGRGGIAPVVGRRVVGLAIEDHAGPDRRVGEPVDHDEGARRAVAPVGVKRDRSRERDGAAADLVERERGGGLPVERVDVHAVAERAHGAGRQLARLLEEILFPRHERLLAHPDDRGLELVIDLRHVAGPHEHVAAAGIDLVFERERHRLRGKRLLELAVEGHDALHAALLPRGERQNLVPPADDARRDRAGKPAEIQVRPQHELHRIPEVFHVAVGADVDGLQERHQRRAGVPLHVGAVGDDVVPLQGRDRHEVDVGQLESRREVHIVGLDLLEHRLVVVDDVHLVDGHDDVLDAKERHDERMPLRLREHAVAGVDQDDREIGRRSARRHVARVLLVAGRVGDDELPLVGREITVGDVDRDPLLPLVLEAVGEEREIDFAAGRAVAARVFLDRGELILVDHLRLVEEPADQRALAVVHAAAGDEPQQLLALVLREIFVDVGRDECRLV